MGQARWRTQVWRGWGLLAAAVALGVAAGALATLWIDGPAASAVGAGLAVAVFGAASARGKALLEKRAEQRESLPRHIVGAGSAGRLPRVRELDDPIALGVHPAAAITRTIEGRTLVDRVPPYVPRDTQQRLRELVATGGFVLLVGDSTAGKTRAAYEAVRALLPDHVLVAPAGRQSLDAIAAMAQEQRRCVVWLDDLERFLGADGLTANLIGRLLDDRDGGRDVLVLATMRSAEHDRYSVREEPDVHGPERDSWRDAHDVLELATVVEVSRAWTGEELRRARAYTDDPRIHAALPKARLLGLAELLAAGPQLARDWSNAWRPGAHPRGAALVTAAVDCRRTGLHQPQPLERLAELAEHYLATRGGALLRPEPLGDAIAWATTPCHGASSLLLPANDGHFLAFDYLIDQSGLDAVPQAVWHTLIARAGPAQALDIGEAAQSRMLPHIAAAAYQNALDNGVPDADLALASAIWDTRDPAIASPQIDSLLAGRRRVLGSDDPGVLRLRLLQALISSQQRTGDLVRVAEMLVQLIEDQVRVLGHDHLDVFETRRMQAFILADIGEYHDATQLLEDVVRHQQATLGADHRLTLQTRRSLCCVIYERGDTRQAIEMLDRLRAECERVLGEDHPRTYQVRSTLAHHTYKAGGLTRAEAMYRRLVRDGERVLGPDHPHTIGYRCWLFQCAVAAENAEAVALLTDLIADRRRALGARSTELMVADDLIANMTFGVPLRSFTKRQRPSGFLAACASALGTDHPFTATLRRRISEILHD